MTTMPADALDLAVEINQVTAGTTASTRQLAELWPLLKTVVPFEAAWIGVFDPRRHGYQTLTAVGHDAANRAYLESSGFNEQVEAFGLFRRDGPICLRDVIGTVAPMISASIDPMTTIAGLAALVGDARAGCVIDRGGMVRGLPGMPLHPLLTPNSRVVPTALAKLTHRRNQTAFLCPDPRGSDDYVRITAIVCPPQAPDYFIALILLSPSGDLHGLTRRELEVLGFIIDGQANQRIARALFVTERTVAAHMEHIRAKLDAPTRTVAAVRSLHLALYLPYQLTGVAG